MTRAWAIETLKAIRVYARIDEYEALNMAIEALEQPHGRFGEWIDDEPDIDDWSYKKGNLPRHCSVCGHRAGKFKYKTYKFCPWCGSDMRGTENESSRISQNEA